MPSAAEPAPITPAFHPRPARGSVVDLAAHRGRRETPAPAYEAPGPEQQLAETVEAMYLDRGLTLTDDTTRVAFDVAMQAVLLTVDGMLGNRIVDEQQHQVLRGMVEGMQRAPAHV